MYDELLDPANNEFVTSIDRIFPRFRTARLTAVVTALGRRRTIRAGRTF